MDRKCVYTVLIGKYDSLKLPSVISPGWEYICFTDNHELKSDIWDIRFIDCDTDLNATKNSRKVKILSHQFLGNDYNLSVFVEGKIRINCNLDDFLTHVIKVDDRKADLILPVHPIRKCIYDEFNACVKSNRETAEVAQKLKSFYEKEQYPHNYGLNSCTMLIKKNSDNLNTFMDRWWEMVRDWSQRDQLSFNYILWKYNGLIQISSFDHRLVTGKKGNYFIQYHHGMDDREKRL
jgi:hypothetical protein